MHIQQIQVLMPQRRDTSRLIATALLLFALPITGLVTTKATPVSAGARPSCAGHPATIVGTRHADSLKGTARRDVIVAGGGADTIEGREGDDIICAGPSSGGTDYVIAGEGNDIVLGGPGFDLVDAGSGRDRVSGGWGDDDLGGGFGADRVLGSRGDDMLDGGPGDDVVRGGPGRDVASFQWLWRRKGNIRETHRRPIHVDLSRDLAFGRGFGRDHLWVEAVWGGGGPDTFVGDRHANVFFPSEGALQLSGRGGTDTLTFAPGDNDGGFESIVIDLARRRGSVNGDRAVVRSIENVTGGGGSILELWGSASRNVLSAGRGTLTAVIRGRGDDDRIFGSTQDDDLKGGRGDDRIKGGRGDDFLNGGPGDNTNDGGLGTDTCLRPDTGPFAIRCEA